jgi:small subunit ribosomal protein S7
MRHKKVTKRQTQPDKIYHNILIAKFINKIMKDGKKSVAEKLIYDTLSTIEKKGFDPITTFEKALQMVSPKVEIKARRVGGANYQVPIEVRQDRKNTLAMRWIIEVARARSNKDYKTFDQKLVAELLDAIEEKGAAITKRNNTLRQAEANKAFSHFRW